jgi:hypothetical protein
MAPSPTSSPSPSAERQTDSAGSDEPGHEEVVHDDVSVLAEEAPALRTATLALTVRAQGTVYLPSPPANVWRGQLGRVLHRLEPQDRHEQGQSLYQQLFRTPRKAVGVPDYENRLLGALGLVGEYVPHPIIVRLRHRPEPTEAAKLTDGETMTVEVVLIEDAVEHVPSLAGAFESLGARGLGQKTDQPDGRRRRGRVHLTRGELQVASISLQIYDGSRWSLPADCSAGLYDEVSGIATVEMSPPGPATEDSASDSLTSLEEQAPLPVRFRTPLRIKHRGSILRPGDLSADALASNLFRRVQGLALCYGPDDAPPEAVVRRRKEAFHDLADQTAIDASGVRWASDTRYNHSQQQRHPIGGLAGTLRIEAPPSAQQAWKAWLRPAEQIHLGKKTSMGLGRIDIG